MNELIFASVNFKMESTVPILPTAWFCVNSEINTAYLNVLETTKNFINVGNCYNAKITSVNWSAVYFFEAVFRSFENRLK